MKKIVLSSVYLVSASVLLLLSCSKQKDTDPGLAGNWEWVSTNGGIANHIHETPASTGKNVQLNITADNKYSVYTNGALTSQGTLSFTGQACIHDHTNKKVIVFSNPADQAMMIERIDNSFLELSDNAYDGVGSVYKRK